MALTADSSACVDEIRELPRPRVPGPLPPVALVRLSQSAPFTTEDDSLTSGESPQAILHSLVVSRPLLSTSYKRTGMPGNPIVWHGDLHWLDAVRNAWRPDN